MCNITSPAMFYSQSTVRSLIGKADMRASTVDDCTKRFILPQRKVIVRPVKSDPAFDEDWVMMCTYPPLTNEVLAAVQEVIISPITHAHKSILGVFYLNEPTKRVIRSVFAPFTSGDYDHPSRRHFVGFLAKKSNKGEPSACDVLLMVRV